MEHKWQWKGGLLKWTVPSYEVQGRGYPPWPSVSHLTFPGGYPTMWPILCCIWCYLPTMWTDRYLEKHYLPANSFAGGNEINYEISFLAIPVTEAMLLWTALLQTHTIIRKRISPCLMEPFVAGILNFFWWAWTFYKLAENVGVDTVCMKVFWCLGSPTLKIKKLFSAGHMWFWPSLIMQKKPIVSLGILT